MVVMFLNLSCYRTHFAIADGLAIDGSDRHNAVLAVGEEYFFRIHHVVQTHRFCAVINGGDAGSGSYAGEYQGAGNPGNHEFILGRSPDDAGLDDAHIRMAGFGEKAVFDEDGIVAAFFCASARAIILFSWFRERISQ